MTIRIIVNGAQGKMGQEAVKAIKNDHAFTLVAETDHQDDLAKTIAQTQAKVVIDFTTPQSAYRNTEIIIQANASPVIGTTGMKLEEIQSLKSLCDTKKIGGIIAPNFALGAVLMMIFSKCAAKYFPEVEIIESHHTAKLDAPSGTAVKTAQLISETRKKSATVNKHETIAGARGAQLHDIPIHSVRLPGYVATQEVIFGLPGETLSIRENSIHREAFMPGLILACKKVVELDHLVYGLENILDISF